MRRIVRVARASLTAGALTLALAGCGAQSHTASATAPTATATTYATPFIAPTATPAPPGQWTPVNGLAQWPATIAPSNPAIAYQIGLTGVQRTTDFGATWTDLGTPRITGDAGFIQPQAALAFVSPINPNTLFMIVDTYTSAGCGQGAQVYSPGSGGAGEPSNATGACEAEFVSVDQGKSWSRLRLPVPGLVTSALHKLSREPDAGDTQAQGARLYALVIKQHIGANSNPPPGRLVVSDDGGETWRVADSALVAAGQGLLDFAATPSGATIFALTEPLSTKPANIAPMPKVILWRSDNAGATWTQPGAPPSGYIGAMRAALVGGTPVLYLESFDAANHEHILASPWGSGSAWQTAPSAGPTGPLPQSAPLLTTLPDGTLLVDAGPILAWRWSAHGGSWRQVAADPGFTQPVSRAFAVASNGGRATLWLDGATESAEVVEYTLLTT